MKRRELVMGIGALASAAPVALAFGLGGISAAQAQSLIVATSKRGGTAVTPVKMFRLDLLAMQFSSAASEVDIDALCDVDGKLYPYRIASFRADAVSPKSKLFGFEMDERALAGFRVEYCRHGRANTVSLGACSAGTEAPYRSLAAGSYVLDMDSAGMGVTVSALPDGPPTGDSEWLANRKNSSYLVFQITRI